MLMDNFMISQFRPWTKQKTNWHLRQEDEFMPPILGYTSYTQEGQVDQQWDEQREPQPQVLSANAPRKVLPADPTPVLQQ